MITKRQRERNAVSMALGRLGLDELSRRLQDCGQAIDWAKSGLAETAGDDKPDLPALLREERGYQRDALAARLSKEGAEDLVTPIGKCGLKIGLTCTNCGDPKSGLTKCRKKWCPACQRQIAAKRVGRMRAAIKKMEWPLMVTLTMTNSIDPESVRTLRAAFGRLRNRKIWADNVRGGVAAVEVTNTGNGWHPHLHALVDCRWLAINTPEPPRGTKGDDLRRYTQSAQRELSATWAAILGQQEAVVWVSRARGDKTVMEILKYSVKGSDLLASPMRIAPMLRVLDKTRLITTFGDLYGCTKELDADDALPACCCEQCGATKTILPNSVIDYMLR